MFNRHKERALRRAALDERYAVLNAEKELQRRNLSERQMEKIREEAEKEKEKKIETKRKEEERKEEKRLEIIKRRDMLKLAKLHCTIKTMRNFGWNGLKAIIRDLRLKERKADVFFADGIKHAYWKRLQSYVVVRKELRADLEARSLRKADEYYYDSLCLKVFGAWKRNMVKLKAMGEAVRSQNLHKKRQSHWRRWRNALDVERVVWWEAEKHADAQGRVFNLKFYMQKLKEGAKESKLEGIREAKVKQKLKEVQQWLS